MASGWRRCSPRRLKWNTSPSVNLAVSRGATVPISYVDNDGDDAALSWLFADMDGNFDTTGDMTNIATARPELNGLGQTVHCDTTGTSFGTHGIHARTWDGTNTVLERTASGTVDVQDVATAASAGGTDVESGMGIAAFPDGSSVVVGHFAGSPTFGLGEATESTPTAVGGTYIFVARYWSTGALRWVRTVGAGTSDVARSVTALSDGSCVVTGWIEFGAIFGLLEPNETLLLTSSGRDVYLARFAADGDLRWVRSDGGPALALQSRAMARFPDGSFGITGFFTDDSVLFGRGGNKARPVFNAGMDDVFFYARYNADGGF